MIESKFDVAACNDIDTNNHSHQLIAINLRCCPHVARFQILSHIIDEYGRSLELDTFRV